MAKIAWLIMHELENDVFYTEAPCNMQAAAIACVNNITQEETTDIIGDELYPTDRDPAAILRAMQTNTDTARKIRIFTDSKEVVTERQVHSITNKTVQGIQRKSKKLEPQYGIQVDVSLAMIGPTTSQGTYSLHMLSLPRPHRPSQ